jgi:hypothetical protein
MEMLKRGKLETVVMLKQTVKMLKQAAEEMKTMGILSQ